MGSCALPRACAAGAACSCAYLRVSCRVDLWIACLVCPHPCVLSSLSKLLSSLSKLLSILVCVLCVCALQVAPGAWVWTL